MKMQVLDLLAAALVGALFSVGVAHLLEDLPRLVPWLGGLMVLGLYALVAKPAQRWQERSSSMSDREEPSTEPSIARLVEERLAQLPPSSGIYVLDSENVKVSNGSTAVGETYLTLHNSKNIKADNIHFRGSGTHPDRS